MDDENLGCEGTGGDNREQDDGVQDRFESREGEQILPSELGSSQIHLPLT